MNEESTPAKKWYEELKEKPPTPLDEQPLKCIRKFCLACVGHNSHEVKLCTASHCPLWKLRLGKKPKGVPSEILDVNRIHNLVQEKNRKRNSE